MESRTAEDEKRFNDTKEFLLSLDVFKQQKPLIKGIENEVFYYIQENKPDLNYSKTCVRRVINIHTNQMQYLKNVAEKGSMRHNLKNEPVEEVSEENRLYSLESIKEKRIYRKKMNNKNNNKKRTSKSKSKFDSKPKLKKESEKPVVIVKKRRRAF